MQVFHLYLEKHFIIYPSLEWHAIQKSNKSINDEEFWMFYTKSLTEFLAVRIEILECAETMNYLQKLEMFVFPFAKALNNVFCQGW